MSCSLDIILELQVNYIFMLTYVHKQLFVQHAISIIVFKVNEKLKYLRRYL